MPHIGGAPAEGTSPLCPNRTPRPSFGGVRPQRTYFLPLTAVRRFDGDCQPDRQHRVSLGKCRHKAARPTIAAPIAQKSLLHRGLLTILHVMKVLGFQLATKKKAAPSKSGTRALGRRWFGSFMGPLSSCRGISCSSLVLSRQGNKLQLKVLRFNGNFSSSWVPFCVWYQGVILKIAGVLP